MPSRDPGSLCEHPTLQRALSSIRVNRAEPKIRPRRGRATTFKNKRRWRDDRDLDAALADAAFGGGWRAAPGASVVDAPDCVVAGDAEATAARLRYLQRTAPPGSPADACTLRWRPPRVAPPPPPPGILLFRDEDFAVLRDAYTGSVAVASRTEVTNAPPLTLV